jgi:hypothetical protein
LAVAAKPVARIGPAVVIKSTGETEKMMSRGELAAFAPLVEHDGADDYDCNVATKGMMTARLAGLTKTSGFCHQKNTHSAAKARMILASRKRKTAGRIPALRMEAERVLATSIAGSIQVRVCNFPTFTR